MFKIIKSLLGGSSSQKQISGDGSTSYQAQHITIGTSIDEVRTIALDVFRANFLVLKETADNVARQRAEEITMKWLEEISQNNPNLLAVVQEPSMQSALYSAQKSYAISGDEKLADLLVDILVKRSEEEARSLRQIVLDESLEVASKLTFQQIDTLSVIFLIRYARVNLQNLDDLKAFLENALRSFVNSLTEHISLYQHLEFSRCGSIMQFGSKIENIFQSQYKGLFCNGLTVEEFERQYGNITNFPNLLRECYNDSTKIQVDALDDGELSAKANENNISQENLEKIKEFFNSNSKKPEEIKQYLIDQGEYMEKLVSIWDDSVLNKMTLTSVGIAIAQTNTTRITDYSSDLSIWII